MRRLTRQNLEDILFGAVILGAGGGGDIREGMELVDHALAAGKHFDLVTLDEVPDDALICTPYMLGAITPMSADEERLYEGLPIAEGHPILTAYDRFQAHLGREFHGTTACELGGSNTATAFFPAAMNGHVILDADPAGRAVPEITHSTYYLAGLPAAPIIAANAFGETFVLDGVKDDRRAETLVRALSRVSRNDIAAIDHALPMRTLRDALIPGTITKAMHLGAVWRKTVRDNGPVAARVAEEGGGFVGFGGVVRAAEYRTEDGFTLGHLEIDGDGGTLRVDVKNENMACHIDGEVFATIPDIITLFDTDTGAPLPNPDCHPGQQIAVVILPAPAPFLTAQGLAIFGPRYAGIDAEYRPPQRR